MNQRHQDGHTGSKVQIIEVMSKQGIRNNLDKHTLLKTHTNIKRSIKITIYN